ncbi:MAG: hypothetical protein U1V55_07595 [Planktothrix rubescens PR222]
MSKLLNAIVKYPATKTFQTQYGSRCNAVLTIGDDEIKIWGEPNTPKGQQLQALKRGETVLVIDDNGKYKLLESDSKTTNTNGNTNGVTKQNYEPLTPDKKREIAVYISDMAGLYGYCLEQAKTLNKEDLTLPPDAIKDIATTLYITSQRHFNL